MNIARRQFSISDLHAEVRDAFRALSEDLIAAHEADKTEFRLEPFEGLRSPDRQASLLAEGTTKAGPWKSAHQYGLATDFVMKRPRSIGDSTRLEWYWAPREHNDWDVLGRLAERHGLFQPFSWDRPHIEHPYWRQIRNVW